MLFPRKALTTALPQNTLELKLKGEKISGKLPFKITKTLHKSN